MTITSKLPNTGTTIFTVMSALANEHGAINLSQGFPNFDPPLELRELIYQHMLQGHNQYSPMAGLPALREVLAEKYSQSSGVPVDADTEITVTAGATQAIFTAITAIVHPGDEVIVFDPAYDCYGPAVELAGGQVIRYQLRAPDFKVDWDRFASLLSERTRLVVVNTPHNPTGTTWDRNDWEQLNRLLADSSAFLLSDEVYEHLVYDDVEHLSALSFPALRERSFVTYSFGKTFHATGWKVGYCIAPAPLMAEFRKVHQFNVFAVNSPAQFGLADYLKDPGTYEGLGSFYQQKRDFFLAAMQGSSLRPLACNGTYFQLFDYSAIKDVSDVEFSRWLTTEIGVAAIPVSAFSADDTGERVIRLCFAKTENLLAAAAERLKQL